MIHAEDPALFELIPEFCTQLTTPKKNQQHFISAYLPAYQFAE